MPGTAGRKARVKVCATSGGTYAVVGGIKSISHTIDGASVDDSEMSVDWMQRIQGLKDGKITISGNRRLADTNGQNLIISTLLNDTDLYVQVLPDNGTTSGVGYQQQVRIAKVQGDSAVDGANGFNVEFEGTGAITLV